MSDNKILVINGPNLNLLGTREPEIYGTDTLADITQELSKIAQKSGHTIIPEQSNHEGEIVTILQNAYLSDEYVGIIINAAAYTHTSIAILDALKLFNIPIIEVHLSNPEKRDDFRKISYIKEVATTTYQGEGKQSYIKALNHILNK